ncbi:hypothetical protein [Mycolicibacterium aubagnense]|nr:hypothetical protein [Mycolicibacterium aubagnense]
MGTQSGLSRRKSSRYRLAVIAAAMGIAAATSQNVAWAETGTTSSPGTSSQSGATHTSPTKEDAPSKPKPKPGNKDKTAGTDSTKDANDSDKSNTKPAIDTSGTDTSATDTDVKPDTKPEAKPATKPAKPLVTQNGSELVKPAGDLKKSPKLKPATASTPVKDAAAATAPTAATAPANTPAPSAATAPANTLAPTTRLAALATTTNTVGTLTTPTPPQPLNPIATILQLPGRLINSVLQALDLTVSQSGPKSPFNWSPISEALFAGFRRIEDMLGLSKTPTSAPVVPELTYTGPTSGDTPTVSQFLNAAADAYVLGGQPGDLKPFTVNGFQMQTFNPLSGAVGKAWVTPEGKIIIAYQGTTGGTNLLFHPLIALSQIVTDMQIIFTNTTPQAFWDSLAFERTVQAAAAQQGYTTDDIYVTGHSLGGWEAQFVAQKTGLGGIGFEGPGLNTSVPGNNSAAQNFVNVETYGDTAAYFSTDLPGLQPFMPAYDPTGGSKPHYGNIVMIGDPTAVNPLLNASALWGPNPINDIVFAVDILGNFLEHHLPGMQAYNLGVAPDPGVVPWLGSYTGSINDWGGLDIFELQQAASDAGVLVAP